MGLERQAWSRWWKRGRERGGGMRWTEAAMSMAGDQVCFV